MEKGIVIVSEDPSECREIISMLAKSGMKSGHASTIEGLETFFSSNPVSVAIIDIDSIQVTNPMIRELSVKYPEVKFLCISRRVFHPELKAVIGNHIYACIQKPVDRDELIFLINSICNDFDE